jgi:hypothetical protein
MAVTFVDNHWIDRWMDEGGNVRLKKLMFSSSPILTLRKKFILFVING